MTELKPCACGKAPDELFTLADGRHCEVVTAGCCSWAIRKLNARDSTKAWNAAPRPVHETELGDCDHCDERGSIPGQRLCWKCRIAELEDSQVVLCRECQVYKDIADIVSFPTSCTKTGMRIAEVKDGKPIGCTLGERKG